MRRDTEDQEERVLEQLKEKIQEARESQATQKPRSPTMFQPSQNENLVRFQLDIKEELARIEHLLRKHIPKIDDDGNMYYANPDEKDKLFNEKGVNEILNILAWYLNKNIILSNFSEDQILQRCDQFHKELTNFIFNNYQEFGLDTKDKIKHFPMVVTNIVNTVEAAYFRAMNGGERESLREARQVTQSEPLNPNMQMPNKSNKSIFKPWTWGR